MDFLIRVYMRAHIELLWNYYFKFIESASRSCTGHLVFLNKIAAFFASVDDYYLC